MKIRIILVFILLLSAIQGFTQAVDTTCTADMYLCSGLWYEIASLGNGINEDCHCTTREFEYIPGRKFIKISVKCIMFRNGRSQITLNTFRAFPVKDSIRIFTLKSRSFRVADMEILLLHRDYNWIVIGSRRKGSLHLLCRDSFMPAYKYNDILKLLRSKDFNTGAIEKTAQNCDILP